MKKARASKNPLKLYIKRVQSNHTKYSVLITCFILSGVFAIANFDQPASDVFKAWDICWSMTPFLFVLTMLITMLSSSLLNRDKREMFSRCFPDKNQRYKKLDMHNPAIDQSKNKEPGFDNLLDAKSFLEVYGGPKADALGSTCTGAYHNHYWSTYDCPTTASLFESQSYSSFDSSSSFGSTSFSSFSSFDTY